MRSIRDALSGERPGPQDPLEIRSNREALIAHLVSLTDERNKKAFAKLVAIAANSLKWSEQDLHALIAKKNDPKVRNFSALVRWSLQIKQSKK